MSAGVFAAMAMSPGALAQQPGAETVVDEITVTGSRIKRADLESASPVTVVQREDIVLRGLTDVGNLIQRMPSMSGSPIGTTTNNGGDGSVQIDLRGLGVDRTLTLVNGHRTVDGGDYQTIPQSMIERVEILKDGASAVYGADAVAGVVNIITRRDFEGLEFNAQHADYFDMDDGAQTSFGMIAGTNFSAGGGSGNFVFGAEYVKQNEAYQRDAPWAFFQDTYYIYPEGCEKSNLTAPYDGTPQGGCYPIGSSRIPEGRITFPTHGFLMNEGDGLVPYDGRAYNFAPVNYIQTPYERTNLFAEGYFDISSSLRFTTALRANFRESAQELAPTPYTTEPFADPAHTVTVGGVQSQGISADNYYLVQALTAAGLAIEPATQIRRRIVEQARRFTQDVTQFQGVFGFEGRWSDLDWELNYNKGYRSRQDKDFGQFSGPRLSQALGPSADLDGDGVPECYADINDPESIIPGCVPLNVLGGAGTITQEMLDFVGVNLSDSFLTNHDIVNFSVTGDAFELPAGPLGWALGAGYYGQSLDIAPDSGKAQGTVTGNKGEGTKGSLYSTNFFGEILAPLFDNGSQAVDLRGGVRYDDYNRFGGETTWQVGLEFQVIPSLKLRGTAGTVFRAPTITDLFGGQADSFPTFSDPCEVANPADLPAGCAQVAFNADSQILARVGGNPELIPETGDTFTVGLVWTPEIGEGNLSLTIDYWKTEIDDGISSFGVDKILDDCYIAQNPDACALVTRNADYSIARVLDPTVNLTSQGGNGVDTEVRYSWGTNFGQFTASVLWAHLLERTRTAFQGAPEEDLAGRFTDPTAQDGGAYAENKVSYSLQWLNGGLSVSYLGEFISSLDADTFCNCGPSEPPYIQKIDSVLYHDLVASFELPTRTTITAGVTNITDEPPPFIEVGFNATTDPSTYRMFGRGYWLRVSQAF